MKHRNLGMIVILIIAGLQLVACGPPSQASVTHKKTEFEITPIAGDGNLHRVVLSEAAAKRLDIQTTPVREEQVTRKRIVGGVVAPPGAALVSTTQKPGP